MYDSRWTALHNLVGAPDLVTFLSLMKKRESIVKAKLLKECDESGEGLEEGERDRQGPKIGQICVKVRDEKRYLHIMQILMVRRVRKQTLEIM